MAKVGSVHLVLKAVYEEGGIEWATELAMGEAEARVSMPGHGWLVSEMDEPEIEVTPSNTFADCVDVRYIWRDAIANPEGGSPIVKAF